MSNEDARPVQPILVVDDVSDIRAACRDLLEEAGYSVAEAVDGLDALRRLRDPEIETPGLILLDLAMPVMDGWELLAILRTDQTLNLIPVILLSASEPNLDPARHKPAAAHLRKPCDLQLLLQHVQRLSGQASLSC